jgi:hypothetical protein
MRGTRKEGRNSEARMNVHLALPGDQGQERERCDEVEIVEE